LERNKKNGPPSAIIKLKNDGTVQIIRDWCLFSIVQPKP
jgi:hypothetical protein